MNLYVYNNSDTKNNNKDKNNKMCHKSIMPDASSGLS